MAVPKRKTSSTKRNKRRSHLALTAANLSTCSQCGEIKLPHRACQECGTYRGEDRIAVTE